MRVVQNSLISEFRATLFFLFNYRKYEERNQYKDYEEPDVFYNSSNVNSHYNELKVRDIGSNRCNVTAIIKISVKIRSNPIT